MEPVVDKDTRPLPQTSMVPKEANHNSSEGLSLSENGLPSASYGSSSSNASYGIRQDAEGFDAQRILAIITRRWPVMLGVFAVVFCLGVFNLLRTKPIYESAATLEFLPTQRNSPDTDNLLGRAFSQGTTADMIATQLENLRSGALQSRARNTLTAGQRQSLGSMATVTINQTEATRLATVDVQSYDANASAALANAICKEFIADSLQKNRANTQNAIGYIEGQLALVRQRLAHAQSELKLFKQKTGIIDLTDEFSTVGSAYADVQKALQAANADRAALASRLQGTQSLLAKLPTSKVVPSGLLKNPAVAQLQNQLTEKELERAKALSGDYLPGSTFIRGLDSEIQAIRAQIKKEAQTVVSGWQPDPARAPLAADVASTQSDLWSLDARIAALKEQEKVTKQNLKRLPEQEFKFSQLNTDTQVLQQTYQLLNQQLQTMRIQEVGATADARLGSEASANPVPVAPDKKRLMIYTIGLGLLAALCVGLVLDLMDNHLYSEDDVHQTTGLPVLVHVPMFRQSTELNLLRAGDAKTERSLPLLETFRMLRTNIRLSVIDKPVRSLMVTSSLPNEGKSHTALNLAVAAANSGDRVVLVDLDLRRPSVHKLCNIGNVKGFTSVVTNQCSLSEAIQETSVSGLSLLTSGPTPPNTFKLLNSQTARSVIEQLSREFDLVVIDTPPVLVIADALLVSSWVDGSLLVISSSEIKKKEVARTVDTMLQNNAEILGTVLTKVSTSMDGYYPYYGYSEYFDQKKDEENEDVKPLPATS